MAQLDGQIRIFIPIRKVDEEKRLVYGTLTASVADKSGEILDYPTAKLAIQAWSDEQAANSAGKSYGNVREMHTNIAAGIINQPLVFDDDNETVEGCSYVSDDSTWKKVLDGTLTGYSFGGSYARRWPDPSDPSLKRYTPKISEVSLVDNPCVPTATFQLIKRDGSTELRKFHHNPENEMTIEAPKQVWLAKDGSQHKLKKDAAAVNASLLAKGVTDPAEAAVASAEAAMNADPAAAQTEVEKAAADELAKAESAKQIAADKEAAKDAKVAAAADGANEPKDGPNADAANPVKDGATIDTKDPKSKTRKAAEATELQKSLYDVSRMADLLNSLVWLQVCLESNDSATAAPVLVAAKGLGDQLVALAQEETTKLFPVEEVEILAMGAKAEGLLKFVTGDEILSKADGAADFTAKLEKASAAHKAHLTAAGTHLDTMSKCVEGMTKSLAGMGLEKDEGDDDMAQAAKAEMAKAAGVDLEEIMTKAAAFDIVSGSMAKMTSTIDDMAKRLATVEAQPAAGGPVINTAHVVQKNHEHRVGGGADEGVVNLLKGMDGMSPNDAALQLIKLSQRNPAMILPGNAQ